MKIGDYVEVDIGMGLGAIGQIVTEDQYMGRRRYDNSGITFGRINPTDTTYRIIFNDGSTHTALSSECRKLTGKELFKAKLSDDKRIYEI